MTQISIKNLTFAYDGDVDNIFDNANFCFDTNWKIGLIGRNGRGKTTFLKLLKNELEYSGEICGNVKFEYFPYNVQNKHQNAIDIIEQIEPEYELWQVMKNMQMLKLSEDCLYKPFENLSGGEQTKLMLSVMFTKQNCFLLIDEPTNHLDDYSRKCVCDFLQCQKSFLLVSHDRALLDKTIDHIISINRNNIEVVGGNFSSWWQNKQNADEIEKQQNQKLKKEIDRLSQSARKTSEWGDKVEKSKNVKVAGLRPDKGNIGHKAAKMMKRAKVIEDRTNKKIEEKSKLLKNIDWQKDIYMNENCLRLYQSVHLKNIEIYYDKKCVAKNINLQIDHGDKIAICGRNGSGKTSVLKLIMGEDICYKGEIIKPQNLVVSYVCQNYGDINGSFDDFVSENKIDKTMFFTYLNRLGFYGEDFETQLQNFSAGQKKKILLAKSLCQKAHIYIWDEPLNYIDVISRIQIEQMLASSEHTILFVEHDEMFVKNVANKILQL